MSGTDSQTEISYLSARLSVGARTSGSLVLHPRDPFFFRGDRGDREMKIQAKYQVTWETDQDFYEREVEVYVPGNFLHWSEPEQHDCVTDLAYEVVCGNRRFTPSDFWVYDWQPVTA